MIVPARRHAARDGRAYEIRSPAPNEAGAVLDHALAIHRDLELDVDGLRRVLARLARARCDLFLVAWAGGAVVGTLSVEAGEVGISVRPAWRRQGVARRLLATAADRAATAGAPRLHLAVDPANEAAVRLYRAAGFRATDRSGALLTMALDLLQHPAPKR